MPNNMILLETIALTQSAASVTFDNLPTSGYTDLKIVVSGRDSSSAGQSWDGYSFTIRPNGLTTNITQRSLFGNGSSAASYSDTSMFNVISMNADTANTFSNVEIYIPNYRSSNAKSFSIDGVTENNATNSAIRLSAGLWNQTAAITSLQLSAYTTWMANSTFSLYGIAALGTTPVLAPKATGGNIVANDGTYWYHAFTSSGNFVPQVALTADCLVIAGGGGAGGDRAGGGGAGGLQFFTSQALTVTNHSVIIGGGGSGAAAGSQAAGTSGIASSFASLVSSTGGGAGGNWTFNGSTGGSGGGGGATNNPPSATATTGGSNTSGQGFAGGNGSLASEPTTYAKAGGGGGATAVGTNATNSDAGDGGNGSNTYSAMATVTSTGVSGYYAGGGGGGADQRIGGAGSNGTGGLGGGGNGGGINNGTANTGSGGGGGSYNGSAFTGSGAGGSGIVIIRYPVN